MMPDLKTLMILYLITNVINAGTMAVIWSQNRGRFAGISFWLVALALQAAGSTLIVLRGMIPDLLSIVLANTMILAGVVMMLMGLERYTEKKARQIHNYLLLVVFIVVCAYFIVVQPNQTAREIVLSAMLIIYTSQCGWLLLRRTEPGMRRITRLTGIVFAVYAAFSVARIILNVIFPAQSNDFFQSGVVNALAITGGIGLNVCLTISLVLMVNRRLLVDVKAQEEKFTTAFQSSPYAIILTRPSDGAIFEVNQGFENLSGYQYAEAIGKTTLGLHLWVREEDRLAVTNELAQGREIRGVEYQFRNKKGQVITGLFSANPVTINNETCILASIGDITDRKRAEEALQRSEEKFKAIANYTVNWESWFGTDGKYLWVNPAVEHLTGYSAEEILAMPDFISTVIAEEDRTLFIARFQDAIRGNRGENFEFRYLHKNGSKLWLSASWQPIFDAKGNSLGVRSSGRDITERKQAEDALRESEEKFSKAFQSSPFAVIISRVEDGTYVEVNDTFTSITGFTRKEALTEMSVGLKLWVNKEDRQYLVAEIRAGRAVVGRESLFRIKSGEVRTGLYSATAIQLSQGLCILSSINDITERKRMEEALQESEKRYREIFDSSSDALVIQDSATGSILDVNKTMLEMYGYADKQEALKCAIEDLSALKEGYNEEKIKEMNQKAIDSNSNSFEWRAKKKDGEVFWAQVSLQRTQIGGEDRIMSSVHDITDRKLLEGEMEKTRADFLFGVSHELKTPLFLMDISLEMLENSPESGRAKRTKEFMETWKRNLHRLRHLVFNMVDSQRTQTMGFKIERQSTDFRALVERVVAEQELLAGPKKVRITLDLAPIPPLWIDPEAIHRLVENLLTNAIKFSPRSGEVTIRLTEEEAQAVLTLKDQGAGISAEEQKSLFLPFQRAATAVRSVIPGTGLGLYVAKIIVDAHGGTISLRSKVGRGTTVTVRLPAGVPEDKKQKGK